MTDSSENLSLYIHFPFCASKCRYCDFYSVPHHANLLDDYLKAIILEWKNISHNKLCTTSKIQTIYFGGGTPSILSPEQFAFLHDELISKLNLSENYEWSIECNPDSYTDEKALIYRNRGVTRLTFGIQSFNNKELSVLGRRHSAEKALNVLNSPLLAHFNSIGLDLMFGIPLQTTESFLNSLSTALSSPYIKHFSLYELTLNDHTPFGRHYRKLPLPDDDMICEMTSSSLQKCTNLGFEHYEISNYALPSFHSRHNEIYWDHKNYIGLGASAHSYFHPLRWSNIADISSYIEKTFAGDSTTDFTENIDGVKLANELLFLGLRRRTGINEELYLKRTGTVFYNAITNSKLDEFVNNGFLIHESPWWRPTEKGMLYADAMARELFI